jgi:signal transduction histidine kinase
MVTGEIWDDGIGFEPEVRSDTGNGSSGLGLLGMRERAAQLGGLIEVISRPGDGTRIRICIPVEGEAL